MNIKKIVSLLSWLSFIGMIWLFLADFVPFDALNIALFLIVLLTGLFSTVETKRSK